MEIIPSTYFELSEDGMLITGKPTFKDWEAYFTKLVYAGESISLAIGDMLNYGFDHWPDEVGQIFDPDNEHPLYKFRTLQNLKYITSRWPAIQRSKYPNTPMSYFQETASLDARAREEVLQEAIDNGHNREWIRQKKRELNGNQPQLDEPDYSEMIQEIITAIDRLAEIYPAGIEAIRRHLETL